MESVVVSGDDDSKKGTATGPNAVGESRKANSFKGRDVRLACGTRLGRAEGKSKSKSKGGRRASTPCTDTHKQTNSGIHHDQSPPMSANHLIND